MTPRCAAGAALTLTLTAAALLATGGPASADTAQDWYSGTCSPAGMAAPAHELDAYGTGTSDSSGTGPYAITDLSVHATDALTGGVLRVRDAAGTVLFRARSIRLAAGGVRAFHVGVSSPGPLRVTLAGKLAGAGCSAVVRRY